MEARFDRGAQGFQVGEADFAAPRRINQSLPLGGGQQGGSFRRSIDCEAKARRRFGRLRKQWRRHRQQEHG
jgi:hypothetical protein